MRATSPTRPPVGAPGTHRRVWSIGIAGALILATFLASCSTSVASPLPSPSPSASVLTTPIPTPNGIAASPPPGGPVPAELQGNWVGTTTRASLTLTATAYALRVEGLGRGNVVVNGDEIDFFNADICGLQLPKGVGRYRWTLASGTLHLASITADPCGRTNVLDGEDYTRT